MMYLRILWLGSLLVEVVLILKKRLHGKISYAAYFNLIT